MARRAVRSARIHYTDTKLGIDTVQDLHVTVPFGEGAVPVDWDNAEPAAERPEDLVRGAPNPAARSRGMPPAALDPRKYAAWTRDFGQWVMRAERLALFSAPSGSSPLARRRNRTRLPPAARQAARESRDAAVEKLPPATRQDGAARAARGHRRRGVRREEDQASQQRTQTMVSFGATVIGALLGRKAVSASTLGRATTAVRGVGRSVKESQDVGRARTSSPPHRRS